MLSDFEYMERALWLAERGLGRTSPNPLVGAVITSPDGVVVGQGFHERAGEPHAEIHALRHAGAQARGATLFCTLEPCCHAGRTGPCAPAIVEAGIARVVAATDDPNPRVRGSGFAYLRAHGLAVDVGVARDAAARLNRPFFTFMAKGRPFVVLKVATSLDGRIAARAGGRTRLTSPVAIKHAHRVRAQVDALAVGSGTVLADDPLLTVREVFRERPLTRVVFDRRLRTPAHARLLTTVDAGPVVIVTSRVAVESRPLAAEALARAGAELEVIESSEPDEAMRMLAARGITSLLVEGGSTLHTAVWCAGLVDRVQVYVAPVVLGREGVPWMDGIPLSVAALNDVRVEALGPDTLLEGDVHRTR